MIKDYVALDIETTGLSPRRDQILEIGAVKVAGGRLQERYASFVNPGIPIPPFITQLTGIDNEMVRFERNIRPVLEEFLEFCGDSVILGHNISFDYGFLAQNAANMGRSFPCMAIDTLQIARKFLPELPGRKLEFLCAYYGIHQEKKHRAYEDAQAAAMLYEKLVQQFADREERAFCPVKLFYAVRKESPITNSQKVYLNDLMKYHRIELDVSVDTLTKSQASRMIDQIIFRHGRIVKR